jgi:hypothetical protein
MKRMELQDLQGEVAADGRERLQELRVVGRSELVRRPYLFFVVDTRDLERNNQTTEKASKSTMRRVSRGIEVCFGR